MLIVCAGGMYYYHCPTVIVHWSPMTVIAGCTSLVGYYSRTNDSAIIALSAKVAENYLHIARKR